jgi:alanine racemase
MISWCFWEKWMNMNHCAENVIFRPSGKNNNAAHRIFMTSYTLDILCRTVNGTLKGDPGSTFQQISVDSRTLLSPEETLFIAIRGERNDGHRFIQELIRKGVRQFLVEALPEIEDSQKDVSFVICKNTLAALQEFIRFHRSKFTVPVLGITGSNGKTIVKEWLYQMLQSRRKIIRSPKSFNSQVGVPLSVWLLDPSYDLAIFEAGISRKGEMKNLELMIQPDIGIITNIKEAHQENFRDYEEKTREKLILFEHCKTIIYCREHELIHKIINEQYGRGRSVTWSVKGTGDINIKTLNRSKGSVDLEFAYEGKSGIFNIPFSDEASLENIMHVISALLWMKTEMPFIRENLKSLAPVAMRLELLKGVNQCTLINDTYNSDIASLAIALDFLNQQSQHRLKTLILSDIFQSGKNEAELYHEVSAIVRKKGITRFIGIGEGISRQQNLFGRGVFYLTTDEFLKSMKPADFSDEAILIKGSRPFSFERISLALQQKIHSTVLEINLNALIHNLNIFRSNLNPGTGIMVMVKAFSYGIGSWEIANALQYQKVDYLSVAFADEGIALRQSGITLPILVMNPDISSFGQMIDHNLEPELYNFRSLYHCEQIIRKYNLVRYPVHIKLDTGMHRLGFSEEEIDSLVDFLLIHDNLEIKSVFSHLAAAEDPAEDDFTRTQVSLFGRMSQKLVSVFPYKIRRHILNSAGIERFPEAQFDMVRLGIGLYGISPTERNDLKSVSTLKSVISQIRNVKKGESVGYNRSSIENHDRTIGIVPIGYADGIDRRIGNGRGQFYINHVPVPVIGNICMDMCFIDITNVPAEEGDEVIIFGESSPVWQMAKDAGTITYEILTGISGRVQRVYYQE